MSNLTEDARVSLANAKEALIDTARATDPIEIMRRSPFISVTVAAGIGAILGMNRRRLMDSFRLSRTVASVVRIVALAIGRYVVAGASHSATETPGGPEQTPAPTYGTTPI